MKIISMAAITIAATVTIACANVSNPTDEPSSTQQWQKKYPQVFSNVGYSKLIESQGKLSQYQNKSEYTQELIGTITNQFGIRDDILNFTLNYFQGNESAIYIAILLSKSENKILFAKNQKEAREAYNKSFLTSWCLGYFSSPKIELGYTRKLSLLMRNNKPRKDNADYIERTYLSNGIYGYGGTLSNKELDQKCSSGAYNE